MPKNTGKGSRVGNPAKAAEVKSIKRLQQQAQLDKATYDYGVIEGRRQMKIEVLTLLENKYMADDAPDKGTPESQAILTLAADLAQQVKAIEETAVQPE